MPIRELARYRITCDHCGAHADYDATQPIDLPEGWEIDRDGVQYAHLIRCYCPTCSEQRKDERMSEPTTMPDLREAIMDVLFDDAPDLRVYEVTAIVDRILAVIAARQPTRAEIWDAAMDYAAMTSANRTMGQNSIWSAAKSVGMEDEYHAISVAVEKRGWSARDDLLALIDRALIGGDDASNE